MSTLIDSKLTETWKKVQAFMSAADKQTNSRGDVLVTPERWVKDCLVMRNDDNWPWNAQDHFNTAEPIPVFGRALEGEVSGKEWLRVRWFNRTANSYNLTASDGAGETSSLVYATPEKVRTVLKALGYWTDIDDKLFALHHLTSQHIDWSERNAHHKGIPDTDSQDSALFHKKQYIAETEIIEQIADTALLAGKTSKELKQARERARDFLSRLTSTD